MSADYDLKDPNLLQGNWNYPTSIRFGVGRSSELPVLCQQVGIQRPLIVTDSGLADIGFVQDIKHSCIEAGLHCGLFSDVKPNPTGTNILDGADAYQKQNHDGVIALGGGSGLDAAKAVALMVGQSRSLWDFEDIGDNWLQVNPEGMAPVIAIPTTSGTGSEVGRASVIVDESSHVKKIIFHPDMLPAQVIADPALTCGLSPAVTAATGIDAFVHCLEAWCAPGFHPMADSVALEGMRLIKTWLPRAVEDGDDLVARSYMMIASTMGATAFQKGLGGIHALAHPLGAIYDKHHGLLNAILIPYVLVRNKEHITERITHLASYLTLADTSFDGFLEWIIQFRRALGIPDHLGAIGISSEEQEKIGRLATLDPSASGNPVQLSDQEYTEIFVNAVAGRL